MTPSQPDRQPRHVAGETIAQRMERGAGNLLILVWQNRRMWNSI